MIFSRKNHSSRSLFLPGNISEGKEKDFSEDNTFSRKSNKSSSQILQLTIPYLQKQFKNMAMLNN